jgi:hypothetical protein
MDAPSKVEDVEETLEEFAKYSVLEKHGDIEIPHDEMTHDIWLNARYYRDCIPCPLHRRMLHIYNVNGKEICALLYVDHVLLMLRESMEVDHS